MIKNFYTTAKVSGNLPIISSSGPKSKKVGFANESIEDESESYSIDGPKSASSSQPDTNECDLPLENDSIVKELMSSARFRNPAKKNSPEVQ